jgi:hypothetical protein
MDYATLVRKLGSLHSLLYDMQQDGVHQGEHTIIYSDRNGDERTLHVYIDGTELQMADAPSSAGLHISTSIPPEH